MTILFIILIIIASVILGFFVLIQNPKGGGLAGSVGGFSNNLMGVKQTTDVLEKGTWIFAAIIGLLCLFSVFFLGGTSSSSSPTIDTKLPTTQTPATPPGGGLVPTNVPVATPK